MNEDWKDIKEAPGYSISSYGNVRSNKRVTKRSNGWPFPVRERILKPAIDSNGYQRVGLMINKKLVTRKIHRLVANAFCFKSKDKNEVNHISGIKTDNTPINLEWTDRSSNVKHAFRLGLAKPLRGSSNPTAKIDEMTALTIKTLIKSGWVLTKIAKNYSVSIHIVKDISRKKTWSHV